MGRLGGGDKGTRLEGRPFEADRPEATPHASLRLPIALYLDRLLTPPIAALDGGGFCPLGTVDRQSSPCYISG